MGKLLDMAIAGSKAASSTTLKYAALNYVGGTVTVFKNGSTLVTLTAETPAVTVTIANGDTIRMTWSGSNGFGLNILYYINNVLQNTYTGTTSIDTGTKTASTGNAYYFEFNGSA
jgi:hypothetical protein